MLRSSSRHVRVFTNRQRNLLPLSGGFSISWQRFCSPSSDSASESPAGDNQNDIDRLLSQNKSRVAQATQVMAQIADLKRSKTISETDYKNDSRFGNMMKLLESNIVQKAEPLIIIQGLKALAELGIDNDSYCVKNLENSLMWSTRSCPIRELMMLLSFTMSRRKTESQNKLFNEVCKSLERRWVEIKDGRVFNSLFYYSEQFSPQFIARLEDRISDVVEEITPGDLVMILGQMGRKKRRNVPLLKTMSFYIFKHKNMLDVKQISDCLFGFNQLSFKDKNVLEGLCTELVTKIPEVESSPVLRSILTSLGQLKYLHTPLIDTVLTWYKVKIDAGSPMASKDLTTLVLTLATLNYIPVQHSVLLQHVAQEISKLRTTLSELVWLDSVWSLSVLGCASKDQLESVLNQRFQNLVLLPNDNKTVASTLKLLNINAAAKCLYQDYDGPTLSVEEDALLRDVQASPSPAKVQFNQSVLEAVKTLCPDPKYSSLRVNSQLGFVVEADLVLNEHAQPLAVSEYSNLFGQRTPPRDLPEGAVRVAVVSASFQDCLLGGELSGLTAFNTKILQARGYKVVLVRHTHWNPSQNKVSRVSQLDQQLKDILGK